MGLCWLGIFFSFALNGFNVNNSSLNSWGSLLKIVTQTCCGLYFTRFVLTWESYSSLKACVNFVVGGKESCLRFTTLLDFQIVCWQFLHLNMAPFLIVYVLCTAKQCCGSTSYNTTTASEVEITLPLNKIYKVFFALMW